MSLNDGGIGDSCPKAKTSPDTEFATYMFWLVGRIVSNFRGSSSTDMISITVLVSESITEGHYFEAANSAPSNNLSNKVARRILDSLLEYVVPLSFKFNLIFIYSPRH